MTRELVDHLITGPMLGFCAGVWGAKGLMAWTLYRHLPHRVVLLDADGTPLADATLRRGRALVYIWAHILTLAYVIGRAVALIVGAFL